MGSYLLCRGTPAGVPYFIECVQLNIYSIEELCYFLNRDPALADETVINASLGDWLALQCGLKQEGEKLKELLETENGFREGLKWIFKCSCYYSEEQLEKLYGRLKAFFSLPETGRHKARADALMRYGKYPQAIRGYEEILNRQSFMEEDPLFRSRVYHGLGCGYGKLFCFAKAKEAFLRAGSLNRDPKILRAWMAAVLLGEGEEALRTQAAARHIGENEINKLLQEAESLKPKELPAQGDAALTEWIRDYHESTGA